MGYLYVAIMAVCLFANSYFKTLAAGRLAAVVLYPMTQGLSLITSAGMSALFFREKVTLRVALALLLAFLALLCINFFLTGDRYGYALYQRYSAQLNGPHLPQCRP